MDNIEFPESNGGLGKPKMWDENQLGPCGYLVTHHDGKTWTSCWRPTAEDLEILNAGGCVYLGVITGVRAQPPVSMYAGHRMYAEDALDYRLPDEKATVDISEVLEERADITEKLIEALEHMPRDMAIYTVASHISLDRLGKILELQKPSRSG